MFLGHFAVGLALKPKTPRTSLGTLFAAAQWLDLVWPVMLVLGVAKLAVVPSTNPFLHLVFLRYPWSHSLLAAVAWGVIFGLIYAWRSGSRGAALWLGVAVVSHWFLDLIAHRPDLPLAPGTGARFGFGLWTHPAATLILEGAVFAAGVWIYARATRPRDAVGRWGFWGLAAFLVLVYTGTVLGPAPPSVPAVAYSGLSMWLLVGWAAWCDRHRDPVHPRTAG